MTETLSMSKIHRIAKARSRLESLGLPGDDPRWSSEVLDQFVKATMQTPGGAVDDVLAALGELLESGTDLTKPVAALIKDIVVMCFTQYRRSYESVDWDELLRCLPASPTKAQLYLAMLAVPPRSMSPQLRDAIHREFAAGEFGHKSSTALAS